MSWRWSEFFWLGEDVVLMELYIGGFDVRFVQGRFGFREREYLGLGWYLCDRNEVKVRIQ